MPNRYTTKIRAKRIALHYFKKPHPFRRWRLILTIAAPAVAAGWLAVLAARGDQRIYNSGPVSTAHAMFGVQCGQCHVPPHTTQGGANQAGKSFWLRVSDRACLKCHDGPIHHDAQTFTPTCAGCHVEHKGHVVLASMSNRHCVQCHANLETKGPTTPFERKVRSFDAGHPEFAVSVKENGQARRVRLDDRGHLRDTAQVKLNHEKHLKPGLKGVDDARAQTGMKGLMETPNGLQLGCTYCHQPDNARAYMAPIQFAKHCVVCHPLDFDARFPGLVVPHDRPGIVHAFLRDIFFEAFEQCQALPKEAAEKEDRVTQNLRKRCVELELAKGAPAEEEGERPRGRLGRREEAEEKPSAQPQQWISAQMKSAKAVVFKQKCEFCHMLAYVPEKLPEVAATAIPVRWLPHSVFDHGVHRTLTCTECHKATQSKETTDVLLPSIAVCRECHREGGGARTGCVACHLYHDKSRDRDLNGPFTIRQLVTGTPPAIAATPAPPSGAAGR